MTDPTQFIVPQSIVHTLMAHCGVLATGRDLINNYSCSLHQYNDQFKRTYVMQHFDNITDQDFVSKKLNSSAKMAHSNFISNLVRPVFMSTKKNTKSSFEVVIFYDVTHIGEVTLAKLIEDKRESGQKFDSEQIIAFFWQVADFLLLSTRNCSEYLDITPINILTKADGHYGYNFFITNFGRCQTQLNQTSKNYHNPKDSFYHPKGRTPQNALRAVMYTFGMILLQMASMLPTKDLYQAKNAKQTFINEKALSKRIEGIKITNDQMIAQLIKKMLTPEQERITISDIFNNGEYAKMRRVAYCSSKPDFHNYKNFEGIIEYDGKTAIGESLDSDLNLTRGTFKSGKIEGRGMRQVADTLEMGIFMDNQLIEGQIIKKNMWIDIGPKFKNNKILTGTRIFLNIASIKSKEEKQSKDQSSMTGFVGQFLDGEPKKGKMLFSDGRQKIL